MACTCRHFTRVLVFIGAWSIGEAVACVSNTPDVLIWFISDPPTVRRRIAVQLVRGPVTCRRLFV